MRAPFIILIASIALFSAWSEQSEAIPQSAIRTQSVYSICHTKTSTIRDVSEKTKREIYKRDGVPGGNHTGICNDEAGEGCEADHRIALWDGGSNHKSNLTIQPFDKNLSCNAHDKDDLERVLHHLICAKKIKVDKAQELLFDKWEYGYKLFVDKAGCGR
ncbi:MAG: hypothetical protein WC714_28580 [Candidatus Obscuribacterales bacterium]|jgi:hypothetical protein